MHQSRETILEDNAFIVSETDFKGNITFANEEFCRVAEYTQDELIGQPHNIIRHPDMPRAAFEDLWSTVREGKVWQGYVKNKTKSNGYYWVFATIYPFKNDKKEQCFMSIRRKASAQETQKHEELYKSMR